MSDIRERILIHIDREALAFVTDGTPMPTRDARWDADIAAAIAKYTACPPKDKRLAKIESGYKDLYKRSKSDLSYDEWFARAQALYSIDADNTVTSIARGIGNEETWACNSNIEAREKILQLIRYKYQDHFNKGCDFMYDPTESQA